MMNIVLVIFIAVSFYPQFALGMTVKGVFSSRDARFNKGQYITSFCFYGMSIKHCLIHCISFRLLWDTQE